MNNIFSRYDLKTTDVSYLNDKQITFLRTNEKEFFKNVVSANPQLVKNGEDLVMIAVSYPILENVIDYRGVVSIDGDISVSVVSPTQCGRSTFTIGLSSQIPQTAINKVAYDSTTVYLAIDTEQSVIDMAVSILSARWSYLHEKNIKKVNDLMTAYKEINAPKTASLAPPAKEPTKPTVGLINKQGAELLAFYLKMDSTDFSAYEYHRGYWTQKVYCINDTYYCPHKTRPAYRYDDSAFKKENWVKVNDISSPYTNNTIWEYKTGL